VSAGPAPKAYGTAYSRFLTSKIANGGREL
jgi:hypothetical protein